jgi:hypothetical protein
MAKRSNPKIIVNPSGPVPPAPSSTPTTPKGMASGFVPPEPTPTPPTDSAREGGSRAPKNT